MIEKIYGEHLSPLVDLMIHEYNERYRLRLFTQPNRKKFANVKKIAKQTVCDIEQIMKR